MSDDEGFLAATLPRHELWLRGTDDKSLELQHAKGSRQTRWMRSGHEDKPICWSELVDTTLESCLKSSYSSYSMQRPYVKREGAFRSRS